MNSYISMSELSYIPMLAFTAFMEEYILNHGSEAEIAKNLNDYRELRWIAKCHQNGHGYANIKSWFLETYPEITEFSIAA